MPRAVATIVQTRVARGNPTRPAHYLDEQLAKTPDDPELQMLSAGLSVAGERGGGRGGLSRAHRRHDRRRKARCAPLYGLLCLAGPRPTRPRPCSRPAWQRMPGFGHAAADPGRRAGKGQRHRRRDRGLRGDLCREQRQHVWCQQPRQPDHHAPRAIRKAWSAPSPSPAACAGSDVPAFQDTYGWIEYRRGNLTRRWPIWNPPRPGLPEDPLAQFHLGMTYVGLNAPRRPAC